MQVTILFTGLWFNTYTTLHKWGLCLLLLFKMVANFKIPTISFSLFLQNIGTDIYVTAYIWMTFQYTIYPNKLLPSPFNVGHLQIYILCLITKSCTFCFSPQIKNSKKDTILLVLETKSSTDFPQTVPVGICSTHFSFWHFTVKSSYLEFCGNK